MCVIDFKFSLYVCDENAGGLPSTCVFVLYLNSLK